jgi:hypothetical protein
MASSCVLVILNLNLVIRVNIIGISGYVVCESMQHVRFFIFKNTGKFNLDLYYLEIIGDMLDWNNLIGGV